MIDLGTLSGNSAAFYVNSCGQVAGTTNANGNIFLITPEDTDEDGVPDVWYQDDNGDDKNDLMINLHTLRLTSTALDLNNLGQIVGTYYLREGHERRAFIATPGVGMQDLGTPRWRGKLWFCLQQLRSGRGL